MSKYNNRIKNVMEIINQNLGKKSILSDWLAAIIFLVNGRIFILKSPNVGVFSTWTRQQDSNLHIFKNYFILVFYLGFGFSTTSRYTVLLINCRQQSPTIFTLSPGRWLLALSIRIVSLEDSSLLYPLPNDLCLLSYLPLSRLSFMCWTSWRAFY